MLQGIIIKKIINLVIRKILKKYDLDNISDYVNNKNDLDWKVEILDKRLSKLEEKK